MAVLMEEFEQSLVVGDPAPREAEGIRFDLGVALSPEKGGNDLPRGPEEESKLERRIERRPLVEKESRPGILPSPEGVVLIAEENQVPCTLKVLLFPFEFPPRSDEAGSVSVDDARMEVDKVFILKVALNVAFVGFQEAVSDIHARVAEHGCEEGSSRAVHTGDGEPGPSALGKNKRGRRRLWCRVSEGESDGQKRVFENRLRTSAHGGCGAVRAQGWPGAGAGAALQRRKRSPPEGSWTVQNA